MFLGLVPKSISEVRNYSNPPPRPPLPVPHPPGFQPGVAQDTWLKRKCRQGRHNNADPGRTLAGNRVWGTFKKGPT